MTTADMFDAIGRWRRPATVARPAAPALAGARDPRLDFYRGIAMIIILFSHIPGNFFANWIPARWGFSDATEIFVFCSGMASAIAFGRTFDRAGWAMGSARVVYRCWQVYWAHIGLFIFVAAMYSYIDGTGAFDTNYMGSLNLWKFADEPGPELVGLLMLTYVPNFFDVLPMYLVILAMMPVMMALARVHLGFVALAVGVLWLMSQKALLAQFGAEDWALELPAEPWSDRPWFFNPFAWQLIFFTGFGFMRGWIPAPPVRPWLIGLALALVIANVPLSNVGVRDLGLDWAQNWRDAHAGWFDKTDFGILRYGHFLALAYLAWVAAGAHGHRLVAQGSGYLSHLWGGLVANVMKIGQQSLAVFVFSMAFARFLGFALDQTDRGTALVVATNLFGVAVILGVAYTTGWFKGQPWRRKGKPEC